MPAHYKTVSFLNREETSRLTVSHLIEGEAETRKENALPRLDLIFLEHIQPREGALPL